MYPCHHRMTSNKDEGSLAQNVQASTSKKKGNIGIGGSHTKETENDRVDGDHDHNNNKKNFKKGPWTLEEDALLIDYVKMHGERHWNSVQKTGLMRCGKSCRLRWTNHLRPDLKKGAFSPEEERIVLDLHSRLGNKWSKIAAELPGRTDNEVKNFWNTKIKRRMKARQLIMLSSPGNQPKEAITSMASFLATTNPTPTPLSNIKTKHLENSENTLTRSSQYNDPILSFLNNPSYKYQFLSEEEKQNYDIGKHFPSSYSPLPRFEFSQHSNVSNMFTLSNFHPHSISLEQPCSQINYHQMPMTSSYGMVGGINDVWLSSYMGENSEIEKSSITEEEKGVFEGTKEIGNKRVWVNHHNAYYNNGAKRLKVEPLDEFLPMDDDLFTLLHDFSSIDSPTNLYHVSNEASSMHNLNKEAFGLPIGASHEYSLPNTIHPSTLDP